MPHFPALPQRLRVHSVACLYSMNVCIRTYAANNVCGKTYACVCVSAKIKCTRLYPPRTKKLSLTRKSNREVTSPAAGASLLAGSSRHTSHRAMLSPSLKNIICAKPKAKNAGHAHTDTHTAASAPSFRLAHVKLVMQAMHCSNTSKPINTLK